MNNNTEPTQEQLSEFVGREVITCASQLISQSFHADNEHNQNEYQEEIITLSSNDDWNSAAREHIYYGMCESELNDYLEEQHDLIGIVTNNTEELKDLVYKHIEDDEEFCQEFNLDPHQNEVLEHWIVSQWLGAKLEAQGESVVYNCFGFTIWGRTCSGQAIMLDGVISTIYKELHS